MRAIEGILFEPIGCLAEFPAEPFHEMTRRFFGSGKKVSKSASRTYWHLLNLLEASGKKPDPALEPLELQAVEESSPYDDVRPALQELKRLGTRLLLTSSLSNAAVEHFLKRSLLYELFDGIWNRDNAEGIKAVPLRTALHRASLARERTIFLTDTAEGIKTARAAGVQAILMMNDPDEAKRLAMHGPAGGIVSFYELPDFVRLLIARSTGRAS